MKKTIKKSAMILLALVFATSAIIVLSQKEDYKITTNGAVKFKDVVFYDLGTKNNTSDIYFIEIEVYAHHSGSRIHTYEGVHVLGREVLSVELLPNSKTKERRKILIDNPKLALNSTIRVDHRILKK